MVIRVSTLQTENEELKRQVAELTKAHSEQVLEIEKAYAQLRESLALEMSSKQETIRREGELLKTREEGMARRETEWKSRFAQMEETKLKMQKEISLLVERYRSHPSEEGGTGT
ncbi:MAG: hypothetical protein HY748_16080 [Elusimicrobia bacterium]|nr:hypothetical protein [Elusimicrobiota bacterium]